MYRLTDEQIIMLHKMMIDATFGLKGFCKKGMLEFAVNWAFYPDETPLTIIDIAAHIGYNIIAEQPLEDIFSNKSVALFIMLVFLEINGIFLTYTDDELVQIGLKMATGKASIGEGMTFAGKPSYKVLRNWILEHQKKS